MYSDIEKQLRRKLSSMKHRCYAKNLDPSTAKHYRDKGIRVCSEWLNDPNEFVKWSLENGYKVGLTIDRIDPEGNYEPSNCQWITLSENSKKAAEDTRQRRKRKAEADAKLREEMNAYSEILRVVGGHDRYFWLQMYDELTEKDRSDINIAVAVLGMLRVIDKDSSIIEAFTWSKKLMERCREGIGQAKSVDEQLDFIFKLTLELADIIKEQKGEEHAETH